jgi:hypothetical protein
MKMRRLAMLAAAVAVGGSTFLAGAPAQAASATASCQANYLIYNMFFTGKGTYTAYDGYHHWNIAYYKVSGGGPVLGNNSNVNIRLRTGSYQDIDPTHWSYNSPDSVQNDTQYAVEINTVTPATNTTYLKFHAIFDNPFVGDRSCKAYTLQI